MELKIELPISEPRFSTYNSLGIGGIIAGTNIKVDNWYLNNSIEWKCNTTFLSGHTSPDFQIILANFWHMSFMEQYHIQNRFVRNCFHEVIKSMLNQGLYAAFSNIDDYYIEGKSYYMERHFAHDGLIYGYDENVGTYKIAAYDNRWIYRGFETSQEGILQGLHSTFIPKGGEIIGLYINPEIEIPLDIPLIKASIIKYLDTDMHKYPPEKNEIVYGIVVYDYISLYLDCLIGQSIPSDKMDQRIFRLLWEHKKCMLDRIIAVENITGIQSEIPNQYSQLVEIADTIRFMYLKYNLQKSIDNLMGIKNRLSILKEEETRLLQNFCEKI